MKNNHIIIAATQGSRNVFTGDLGELTKIANTGSSQCFYVDEEQAKELFDAETPEDGLRFSDGEGWYFAPNGASEPQKASSQIEAICGVLGHDTHFFRCFTVEEAKQIAQTGIQGHFGIESTRMLRETLAGK